MKKFTILFIIAFVQLVFAQDNFRNPYPKIISPFPKFEFGTILEGQIATHSFEIENQGTADLQISKVRASCGCTVAEPAQEVLKPGEKTNINVQFDTHGRLGPQYKRVYVSTNDPKTPDYELSFTAVVVDKLEPPKGAKVAKLVLNKKQIDFGDVEEGKVAETTIGFTNEGSGTLEIIDVKTSCGCTAALLSSKKLGPGQKGTVKIEIDTANREGVMTRTVTLYSNDPLVPNQTITLTVNIEKRKS